MRTLLKHPSHVTSWKLDPRIRLMTAARVHLSFSGLPSPGWERMRGKISDCAHH